MEGKKRRYLIGLFVICLCAALCVPDLPVNATTTGSGELAIGETKTFSAYLNPDSYTISSYNWYIIGSGATILYQNAHTCIVQGTSAGTAYLYYNVTSTYTYYVYTNTSRTKKKAYTNTDVQRTSYTIYVGEKETVTFDANGGTVSDANSTKEVLCGGSATYGTLPTPTRTGYVFDGWYTAASGGTEVKSSTVVTTKGDHTLYAHWVANMNYTIRYDGNGNTGGTMSDTTAAYGTSIALAVNAYTRDGYRFVGWNTKQDGTGTTYDDKANVKNLTQTPDDVITLYAVWDNSDIASGTCGDNLTWVIDSEGTLTISGEGKMVSDGTSSKLLTTYPWRKYIGEYKKIVIEEGITSVGCAAFGDNILLPSNNDCTTELELPSTLTYIGYDAFGCTSLVNLKIPDNVTEIDDYAFNGCKSLTNVELGSSLQKMGDFAFYDCSFEEITIPASVESVGKWAINSSKLRNIFVDDANSVYSSEDGILFNKEKTELITYPVYHGETVYIIPSGVTKLGDFAFYSWISGSPLETVIIPSAVAQIGTDCFGGNSISNIYFHGEAPNLLTKKESGASVCYSFANVKATIYYPANYASSWNNAKTTYNSAGSSSTKPTFQWKTWTPSTIDSCTVTLDEPEYEYDGTAKTPKVTVEMESDGVRLVENDEYTVSYKDNIVAGTASVEITGKGLFEGSSKTVTFPVYKAMQVPSCAISSGNMLSGRTMQIEDATGQGAISYKSSDSKVATVDENGLITAVGIGTATITVTAAGDDNYESGDVELEITVEHNEALEPESITAAKTKTAYCVDEAVNVDDIVVTAAYSDGYTETVTGYTADTDSVDMTTAGDKSLAVSYNKGTKTVTTNITLQVSEHVSGTAVRENEVKTGDVLSSYDEVVYCTACKKKLSRTTKKFIEACQIEAIPDGEYTGAAITPAVTVKNGSETLTLGKDCTVTYTDNVNVGEATVTVTGCNVYGGTITATFNINQAATTVKTAPTAASIVYGRKLSDSSLSGGEVLAGTTKVDGVWSFENPEILPAVADSGTTKYKVLFKPSNKNYSDAECEITLQIDKADVPDTPQSSMELLYSHKKLSNDILASYDGWSFADADLGKSLTVGTPAAFVAHYNDSDNYKNTEVTITLTRLDCGHNLGSTKVDAVSASCTKDGSKGYWVCKACDTMFTDEALTTEVDDVVIPATGHSWKTDYTIDKSATATAAGSKSIHCSVCDTVKDGSSVTIPATGTTDTTESSGTSTTESNGTSTTESSGTSTTENGGTSSTGSGTQTTTTTENTITTATPARKGSTVKPTGSVKGTFTVTKTGTKPEVSYKPVKNVTSATIPATIKDSNGVSYKVTSIAANAFKGNTKLKTVTIGSNVKTIGANAFYGCKSLTKVTIGKNVTSIGSRAFYNCKKLKTITIKTTKLTSKNVGSKAFKGINAKATIKVPKSRLKAYKKLLKSKGVGTKAKIKK